MSTMREIKTIDLTKYGMTGTVEMAEPTLRQKIRAENETARYISVDGNGKPDMAKTDMGSFDVAAVLGYVKDAPFKPEVESFLTYTDGMEPDAAEALYLEMRQAALDFGMRNKSPFVVSPAAGTPPSA